MAGFANLVGNRVKSWFSAEAEHVTVRFFPEPDAEPLVSGDGYLRLWLSEGFLATAVSWGNQHFPALHGGATLTFARQLTPFTRFTKPATPLTAPGAYLEYPMTTLLPFAGGTVEVEAALYQVSVAGPLAAAVEIGGRIASLIGPPLSIAATVADKISDGLDAVLSAQNEQPVLGLHHTLISAGGGGETLRPGHLVLVNAPPEAVPAGLRVEDNRLRTDRGLLTGFDYLVLRIECRAEHDELQLPHLGEILRRATEEWLSGHEDRFTQIRAQAITDAIGMPDLIDRDRFRVAKYVAMQIDKVKELGAVPEVEASFDSIRPNQLPSAAEVADLTMPELLRS